MDLEASHERVMAALAALENLQADELWLELPQDVRQHLSCTHAILSALSENDYY